MIAKKFLTSISLSVLTLAGASSAAAEIEIKGKVDCKYGDADCNVCATSVRKQFFAAFDDDSLSWRTSKWHFNWSDRIGPEGHEPGDVLGEGIKRHVQGFVRTNNDTIRYAMSHSADPGDDGAFFFVGRDGKRNELRAMHRSDGDHPMSMFEIGQYVGSVEGSRVRLFDVRRINEEQKYRYTLGNNQWDSGGGIAMAKLASGGHLLVASGPGAQNHPDKPRYTSFFHLKGPLTNPTGKTFLGQWEYTQPSSWNNDYKYSDNLSLITECKTGDIYAIHASGEEAFNKRGYWRLSKVFKTSEDEVMLAPLGGRFMNQDNDNCWLRGGASVHVNKQNELEFFCHERKVVTNFGFKDSDSFSFKWGTPEEPEAPTPNPVACSPEGKTKEVACRSNEVGTGKTYVCRNGAWVFKSGFCEIEGL